MTTDWKLKVYRVLKLAPLPFVELNQGCILGIAEPEKQISNRGEAGWAAHLICSDADFKGPCTVIDLCAGYKTNPITSYNPSSFLYLLCVLPVDAHIEISINSMKKLSLLISR